MFSISRSIRRTALLLGMAFGISACSDGATQPESGPGLRVTIDRMAPDSTSATFTVTRNGGTFRMGKHVVEFPNGSICDPATSSYGVGEWDMPCDVIRDAITIHAEVRKIDGKEWVDFTPSLRFVPSKSVIIYMHTEQGAAVDPLALRILWAPAFGAEPVDESVADPSLATTVVPEAGVVYRRIKHFSGYMVASGRTGYADDTATGGEETVATGEIF